MTVLYVDDHIGLSISVHIFKDQCHSGQILSIPNQGRPKKDLRLCRVTSGNLDNFNTTIQVESNKMTRISHRIIMPHYKVCLERPGTTITPVVLRHLPPSRRCTEDNPSRHHYEHG